MPRKSFLLLSFDVEEFDMPIEYGQVIPEQEQLKVGHDGLEVLTDMLDPLPVTATYFTTANFASCYPELIRTISHTNEIASHTFYHSHFKTDDLFTSRKKLEEIIEKPVKGLRMPRMQKVNMADVFAAGYDYDSSINPTWVPGRYNNLRSPRKLFVEKHVLRLPVAVSPITRIPLFWLSFKNFPYPLFLHLLRACLKKDGYACLYFHPWEFVELDAYKIPGYAKRLSGKKLQQRFVRLINDLSEECEFISIEQFIGMENREKKQQLYSQSNILKLAEE